MTDHPDMHTRSGAGVWFDQPHRTPVLETDLRHALANVVRYNGHFPITVLQHLSLCTNIARRSGMGVRLVGLCAAHDLHEAYIGDLCGTMKRLVPSWETIEGSWERHVHMALGLTPPSDVEAVWVKDVDLRALVIEMTWARHPGLATVRQHFSYEPCSADLDVMARIVHRREPALWSDVWTAVQLAVTEASGVRVGVAS